MSEIEKSAQTNTEQSSVLAGGGVDEIADINKGNEVNFCELGEISLCENDDWNTNEKKKTQSSELNSEFARKRREFERRAELDRVREETRISTLIEFTGGVNPYTLEKILDKSGVEKYLAMREIEKNGGDPQSDYLDKFSTKKDNSLERPKSLCDVGQAQKDSDLLNVSDVHLENQNHLDLEKSNKSNEVDNVHNLSSKQDKEGDLSLETNEWVGEKKQESVSNLNDGLEENSQMENLGDENESVWYESDRVDFFASHPEISEDDLKDLFQDEQFILFGDGKFGVVPLSEIYDGYKSLVQVMEERAKMVAEKLLSNSLSSPGALGSNELTHNKTWENMSAKEFELEIQKAKNGGYRAV